MAIELRIAFFGSKGSGKTLASAAFVNFLKKRAGHVIAISDNNGIELQDALEIRGIQVLLGKNFGRVFQFLEGERQEVKELGFLPPIGSFPPGTNSKFIKVSKKDSFLSSFALQKENISLLSIGSNPESQKDFEQKAMDLMLGEIEGKEFSKTAGQEYMDVSSLSFVLNRILDNPIEFVILDSSSFNDYFLTESSFCLDLKIFVVEPSRESIMHYCTFFEKSQSKEKIFVLANKIKGRKDIEMLLKEIDIGRIIDFIPEFADKAAFFENTPAFKRIVQRITCTERNWESYYQALLKNYNEECIEWFDKLYGIRLEELVDKKFNYEKAFLTQ
ncbi:MAG: hypothetical protein Q7R70_01270 [Candidatus Diapherotrites archaeon]|nr:hypothetical protein [Candidatus Diapherotrites archaeon]